MIISKTTTYIVQVIINNKLAVIHRHSTGNMVYLHLTLIHSKRQGQGHAHFDNEYLGHGDKLGKITILIKQQVMYGVSIGVFTLANSKGQGLGHAYFDSEQRCNGDILGKNSNRHQITSHICMGFRMECVHLSLTHSEGQVQGHANFYRKCMGNGKRQENFIIVITLL